MQFPGLPGQQEVVGPESEQGGIWSHPCPQGTGSLKNPAIVSYEAEKVGYKSKT